MTRYEKASIIAYRIRQLESGSEPLVKVDGFNFLQIALAEYKAGKLRYIKLAPTVN